MKNKQPIVIIGGMGPQASAKLYGILIDKCITDFAIQDNADFPHIIIDSLDMPDFISDTSQVSLSVDKLKTSAKLAESLNPVAVGMACNTAHFFENQMLEGIDLPFISMVDVVVKEVQSQDIKVVGLLASPTTFKTRLYQTRFQACLIKVLQPSLADQKVLETIIRRVISGGNVSWLESELTRIGNTLKNMGAEVLILGCTELPVIAGDLKSRYQTIDSLEVLADALLQETMM